MYKNDPSYHKIFFKLQNYLSLSNKKQTPQLLFEIKSKLNSTADAPIYEQQYLGGDYNVRGYDINPSLNDIKVQNKLKFYNFIIYTTEIQIPITIQFPFTNQFPTLKVDISNLLFFVDYGIGSNSYKNFSSYNKIIGYGFGINLKMINNKNFSLCVGLNKFGDRNIHFILD